MSHVRGRFDVPTRRHGLRHRHGFPGDLDLGDTRDPRQLFNCVSVSIPGREVHLPEGGTLAEDLIDQAHAFDELSPVEPRDQSHARDYVSDRYVHRRLALVLQSYCFLGRCSLGRKKLLHAAEGRRGRGILIAQTLVQLHACRGRERPG